MEKDKIRYQNNIIYTTPINEEPDPRGIGYVYFEYMSKNKKLLAQLDGATGVEDTFGELLQRCIRTAITLKRRGINYGDVISVCTYNHLNSCVPHIAGMFVGAKVAAIDPSFSLNDASYLLQQVMPKLIFAQPESVELIENVIRKIGSNSVIVVFGPTDTHVPFSSLTQPQAEEALFEPVKARDIRDVIVIMFSSGTTGFPKGICHTHYSLLRAGVPKLQNINNTRLFFAANSPYWNVFLTYLHRSILTGATRLIYPEFDIKNPWKIFSHKLTTLYLDITNTLAFCNFEKPEDVDTSSLGVVTTSGSPVTEEQIFKIRSLFPNAFVRISYGQSEIFPNLTQFEETNAAHIKLALTKKNSCGLPKKGVLYKIVDEAGCALGPNEKGELLVKTDMQLSGYYNVDSSDIWDSDGWLKTGDYGYYDEDFCFFIVDRLKEMFKYRYWHIIPAVLESILQTHPAVYRAIVIGIPHEIDNYHPMAVIQLKPSARNISTEEIEKFLEKRVEDRQRLRAGVKFVDDFPIAPSGKVMRMKLKSMILQNEI